MNYQQFQATFPHRITRKTVADWVATNRPSMGIDEINGNKGIYNLNAGQAASFRKMGETWREVLQALTIDAE